MSKKRKKKCIEATAVTGLSSLIAYLISKRAGATAMGMLLKGSGEGAKMTGVGAPAGPVLAVVGATTALAFYGLYQVFQDDD